MKVHCPQQYQATLEPSGAGGVVKEWGSGSARTRAVGEGPGYLLEERRGCGDVNWSEERGDVRSRDEMYCGEA